MGRRNWNHYIFAALMLYLLYKFSYIGSYFPEIFGVNVERRPITIPWDFILLVCFLIGLTILVLVWARVGQKKTVKKWEEEDIPRWQALMEKQRSLREKQEEMF